MTQPMKFLWTLSIFGCLNTTACSDAIAPAHGGAKEFRLNLPSRIQPPVKGVQEFRGLDASREIGNLKRSALAEGNSKFAASLREPQLAATTAQGSVASPTTISMSYSDLSGTGTPPAIFDPASLGFPRIVSSYTAAGVVGYIANFVSSMTYENATIAQTDLTWNVKGADNTIVFPPTTTQFSSFPAGLPICIADILTFIVPPHCDLSGEVHGLVQVSLPRNCDLTASAHSLHTASLAVPKPLIALSPSGWTISIGPLVNLGTVTGGNGEESGSAPPCTPVHEQRRVLVSSDGGGESGGSYIINFPERQIITDCYAIQDRTVQSDGYAGPWITIGTECYSYAASVAFTDGFNPSANSTEHLVSTGIPFTLAGTSAKGPKGGVSVLRRGKNVAAQKPDVITLSLDDATADDLADAMRQLLALNDTARQGSDVTQAPSASNKGKGAGKQKDAYDKLLKELKQARHANVDGVGDAAVINVIGIP